MEDTEFKFSPAGPQTEITVPVWSLLFTRTIATCSNLSAAILEITSRCSQEGQVKYVDVDQTEYVPGLLRSSNW